MWKYYSSISQLEFFIFYIIFPFSISLSTIRFISFFSPPHVVHYLYPSFTLLFFLILSHSSERSRSSSSCCCSSSSPTQSRWVSWLLSFVLFFFYFLFFAFSVMIWLILKLCFWVCILVIWLCLSLEIFERKIVYCYDL